MPSDPLALRKHSGRLAKDTNRAGHSKSQRVILIGGPPRAGRNPRGNSPTRGEGTRDAKNAARCRGDRWRHLGRTDRVALTLGSPHPVAAAAAASSFGWNLEPSAVIGLDGSGRVARLSHLRHGFCAWPVFLTSARSSQGYGSGHGTAAGDAVCARAQVDRIEG